MKTIHDGINTGVGWCVASLIGTGFDLHADVITISIDKGIELGISDKYVETRNDRNIEGLVTGANMLWMVMSIEVLLVGYAQVLMEI